MKLQEHGLISLEWVESYLEGLLKAKEFHLKEGNGTTVQWVSAKICMLEDIKSNLISPIPLAEKIWDSGVESGNMWTREDGSYSLDIVESNKDKEIVLNSDIKF